MHHVMDTEKMIGRFYNLLTPGGWLAIADLYKEEGSFHKEGFAGHHGFDPAELQSIIENEGFRKVIIRNCCTIKKMINDQLKEFPVFLLLAVK